MRAWKHSGFSVDNSVYVAKDDKEGMQRLIEYIARCPFSLSGDATLMAGIPRNFEVYDPLDFLAEVTQHIPNKGQHQIRYYGWYSNKKRGMQVKRCSELVEGKKPKPAQVSGQSEPDTPYRRKCRMTWAALIKVVYEVDPLKCPKCGGTMKIVSFIEESLVIEKILRHCDLWKEPAPRPPPQNKYAPVAETELYYDYTFSNLHENCLL
jgi:hypothetical protein